MTFPLKIIGNLKSKVPEVKILVTMDMSTPSTAGINLTFASGILNIDWKEGGGLVPFVSGVELTHTYTTPGAYIAEISGSLGNITKFIADNSKITQITDIKTGLLTDFQIQNNLFVGILDMSLAPVSIKFWAYSNSGLTGITFAISGNGQLNDVRTYSCNLTGVLDFTNVTLTTRLETHTNPLLTGITFASSGNGKLIALNFHSCNFTGILNLSNMPIENTLFIYSNPLLTGVTFASSGNGQLSDMRAYSSNLTGTVDFSNITVSGRLSLNSNPLLTGVTFATSGNGLLTNLSILSCNFTGALNLVNNPIGVNLDISNNPLLTAVAFASSGNTAVALRAWGTGIIGNFDLSNVPLNLVFYFYNNTAATSVTFATSGNSIVKFFRVYGCNLTGTLDLANVPLGGAGGEYRFNSNPNLTNITFSAVSNGILSQCWINDCSLPDLDFSVFPTSDAIDINQDGNSMTATEHDNQLINLDATSWINGALDILTGNTARTAASDTAYNNLIANGWTIT